MGCGVTEALDLVVCSGDDLPAANDDSTDGYFARFVGKAASARAWRMKYSSV